MMNINFSAFLFALRIKEFIANWPFVDYWRRVFPIHPLPGPTIHSLHMLLEGRGRRTKFWSLISHSLFCRLLIFKSEQQQKLLIDIIFFAI